MNTLELKKLGTELGPRWEINNINLKLQSSQCAYFIGSNGSGKSTALRLIAGLYPHNKGEISFSVNNKQISKKNWRENVSFLPETFNFPPKQKIGDTLRFFLRLRGHKFSETRDIVKDYFKKWRLNQYFNVLTNECSIGIQQQIKVALLLMDPTALIILDEPMESLDPRAQLQLWKQIKITIDQGSMVLVSLFSNWPENIEPQQVVRLKEGKATTTDDWKKALMQYEEDLADI